MAKSIDTVITQIQALMNKSEGAKSIGDLAEAETAGSMAQQLLMKYNLSMDQVQESEIQKRAKYSNEPIFTGAMGDKREGDWITKLYKGVAVNNLCYTSSDRGYIRLFGHKDNIALVKYICDQLVSKIRMAEKGAWNKYQDGGYEKRGTFRRGFFEGAAYGIQARLRDDLNKMKEQTTDNPYAIMIVRSEAELKEYLYTLYPHMRPETKEQREESQRRYDEYLTSLSDKEKKKLLKAPKVKIRKGPKGLSSNDGWTRGFDSGQKMDINKGRDGSQSKGNIS